MIDRMCHPNGLFVLFFPHVFSPPFVASCFSLKVTFSISPKNFRTILMRVA